MTELKSEETKRNFTANRNALPLRRKYYFMYKQLMTACAIWIIVNSYNVFESHHYIFQAERTEGICFLKQLHFGLNTNINMIRTCNWHSDPLCLITPIGVTKILETIFHISESKHCSHWSEILYLRSMQLSHLQVISQGLNPLTARI